MNRGLSVPQACLATLLCALLVFFTRFFPFALFSKKNPPPIIKFIEKYIPSLMMGILLAYSLKDATFTKSPFAIPQLLSLFVTVALHLRFKNSLVSILGGTALFMILSHLT